MEAAKKGRRLKWYFWIKEILHLPCHHSYFVAATLLSAHHLCTSSQVSWLLHCPSSPASFSNYFGLSGSYYFNDTEDLLLSALSPPRIIISITSELIWLAAHRLSEHIKNGWTLKKGILPFMCSFNY